MRVGDIRKLVEGWKDEDYIIFDVAGVSLKSIRILQYEEPKEYTGPKVEFVTELR